VVLTRTNIFRLYHTEISTNKRWMWREEGYSPSEPQFIRNPMPVGDDDGCIISLVSPLSTENYDLKYVLLSVHLSVVVHECPFWQCRKWSREKNAL